ncbi:MAG: HIT domain-containing protein [Candidatus Pacearchaeota archaeon]
MDCVFCNIVKGKIPCYKLYEDSKFLAFLDIRPLNPGHTLIIPKKHYRWVWDVPNIDEYFKVVKKIANAIRKAIKTEWVISLVIGEAVPHAHVWLVPRFKGDGHLEGWLDINNVKKIPEKEMKKIAEKIKRTIY